MEDAAVGIVLSGVKLAKSCCIPGAAAVWVLGKVKFTSLVTLRRGLT